MLDSIYHIALDLVKKNCIFGIKMSIFCHLLREVGYNGCHYVKLQKSVNHLWFIHFIPWCSNTPRRAVML